jgi:penicillin-binding protein 2
MARLLGVLILAVAGWAAWSYVLRPVLQPPASASQPAAIRATATPRPATTGGVAGPAAERARHFLSAWAAGRYADMYGDLSPLAQQAISRTAFVNRYAAIASVATITGVRPSITAMSATGDHAVLTYTAAMSTTAVGPIVDTYHMPLRAGKGRWGIDWTPDLIFNGLAGSHLVHLLTGQNDYHESAQRGTIVDRQGNSLAVQGSMKEVNVVPGGILHGEKSLLAFLSGWLHMPAAQIRAMYHVSWAVAHPTERVPIATVTSVQWDSVPPGVQEAQQNNGLYIRNGASRRLYPRGALAAPLLGYVGSSAAHGQAGLEHWADKSLSGQDGAKLEIATAPDYAYPIRTIKERPKSDGATVHTTLDATLQGAVEQALSGKVGSVVALRPSDGAVLAMASTPGYDPNLFASGSLAVTSIFADKNSPLLNRAAISAYPLGSVFKMVTLGAALEKLHDTIDTQIPGPGTWYGLPGYPKHDWAPQGHGIVSLHEALVQSCDTCFYQIGQQLDNIDHNLLPDYARAWGFGAPTGIVGVRETSGLIPDPHYTLTQLGQPWVPGNAVDMAIGQGFVQVTPLQAAQMLAALGNNGAMYRPYVVRRITAPNGAVIRDYPPTVARTLPLSAAHIKDILGAMRGVTTEPAGTAVDKFVGFGWPVAGKTGTAQSGDGRQAHAWFAALAPADHPRIALIVMVEHGGEGAAVAAPLARQILQTFFTKDQDLAGTAPAKGPAALPVP